MRKAQIFKQLVIHVPVVMLSGVKQQGRNGGLVRRKGTQNRGHLHEVRAGADDTNYGTEVLGPNVRHLHFHLPAAGWRGAYSRENIVASALMWRRLYAPGVPSFVRV